MIYDAVVLLLLIYAGYKGYQKGLIQAFLSLIGYLLGLWLAVKCSAVVAERMEPANKWLPFLVFFLIMIAVGWVLSILGKSIRGILKLVLLGWLDRMTGMLMYLCICSLIISFFVFFLTAIQMINIEESQSKLIPILQPLGPKMIGKLDTILPFARDSFEILRNFFNQSLPKIAS